MAVTKVTLALLQWCSCVSGSALLDAHFNEESAVTGVRFSSSTARSLLVCAARSVMSFFLLYHLRFTFMVLIGLLKLGATFIFSNSLQPI